MQEREEQPSGRRLSVLRFRCREGRRGLARQVFDRRFGFGSPLRWKIADINHDGRLKGPGQRLNPRHHRHEADPAHQIDRLGFGMVAGDGDSSGKTKHKHNESESDDGKKKKRQEGCIIPKVERKTQQSFHGVSSLKAEQALTAKASVCAGASSTTRRYSRNCPDGYADSERRCCDPNRSGYWRPSKHTLSWWWGW